MLAYTHNCAFLLLSSQQTGASDFRSNDLTFTFLSNGVSIYTTLTKSKKKTKTINQSYILMYHVPELHSFHDLNIHILDDWVILWLYFVPYISEQGCKVKFPLHFCYRRKFECMEESNDTSPFTLGCLCSNMCTWPEALEQSHSCQTSWWCKSCKIFVQLC